MTLPDLNKKLKCLCEKVRSIKPTPESTFSVNNENDETVSVVHNGTTYPILHNHPDPQGLQVNVQPIYHENYAGGSANGTTQAWIRNLILTRTAVGRWNATFSGAHPDGNEYHPTITAEEQSGNRDTPDITVVQGSKTAAGFQLQITTGDNGAGADIYVDTPFTVGVDAPQNVVTAVAHV